MRSSDFVHEIEIGVSRESLCTFLGDLHNYVALHPLIVSIDELEPLAERPNARRYRVLDRIPVGPFTIRASYVAELETMDQGLVRGRAWQRPGVRVKTEYELTAVDAGTRLVERVAIDAPRLMRAFVVDQARRAHRDTLDKMKLLLER